jgi:hypothetical protein
LKIIVTAASLVSVTRQIQVFFIYSKDHNMARREKNHISQSGAHGQIGFVANINNIDHPHPDKRSRDEVATQLNLLRIHQQFVCLSYCLMFGAIWGIFVLSYMCAEAVGCLTFKAAAGIN